MDDVGAWVYSRSGSAPHLFGHRFGGFEVDLRSLLEDSMTGAAFSEIAPDTVVHILTKPVWRGSTAMIDRGNDLIRGTAHYYAR